MAPVATRNISEETKESSEEQWECELNKLNLELSQVLVNISENCVAPSEVDLENLLEVNLSHKQLAKCPKFLKDALKLRFLDLSSNVFTMFPELVESGLRVLKKLNLNKNKIREFKKPACLHYLREIYLSENKITKFPDWLFNENYSFIFLDLSHNPLFTGTKLYSEPQYFCKGLIYSLNLKNTSMSEKHLPLLKYFPMIVKLDLGNSASCNENVFLEFPVAYLPPNLEELKIVGVVLSSLPDLSSLASLMYIDASLNPLSFVPKEIASCSSLETLILSGCSLYELLEDVGSIKTLRHLDLSHNDIPKLPDSINNLNKLEYLDLYDNSLFSLPDLNGLIMLQKLDLWQNEFDPSNFISASNKAHDELKNELRLNCSKTRKNEPKDSPSEFDLSNCEDSCSSLSLDSSPSSLQEQTSIPREEENWDDDFDLDEFDPTVQVNMVLTTPNEDPLIDSLTLCPEEIKQSPFYYHPGMERFQLSFYSHSNVSRNRPVDDGSIDGQFDDI